MVDVTLVIPCLNESRTITPCVANARAALAAMRKRFGLTGEVVVADNGSNDGSQVIARRAGARVVAVARPGYGAAIIGGMTAAKGRFLVMGDADGSYDFLESVPMVEKLLGGAELCMGSRFAGEIKPGAMPWKNRYIGNPVLSGFLRLLFRSPVGDAHCGLRALTRDCFDRLKLSGSGMEFASEMVIKAALLKVRTEQVPITLHPDLRDRAPHLRPWRDGWRHLRYLLMLSPTGVFAIPALVALAMALVIFAGAGLHLAYPTSVPGFFGNYWVIGGSALASAGHMAAVLAVAGHLYGVRAGYRRPGRRTAWLSRLLSLESMIVSGLLLLVAGTVVLSLVALFWAARDFTQTYSVLPVVGGTLLITLGVQNITGGFLLAIIGGNEARFLDEPAAPDTGDVRIAA